MENKKLELPENSVLDISDVIGRAFIFRNLKSNERVVVVVQNEDDFKNKVGKMLGGDWTYFDKDMGLPCL